MLIIIIILIMIMIIIIMWIVFFCNHLPPLNLTWHHQPPPPLRWLWLVHLNVLQLGRLCSARRWLSSQPVRQTGSERRRIWISFTSRQFNFKTYFACLKRTHKLPSLSTSVCFSAVKSAADSQRVCCFVSFILFGEMLLKQKRQCWNMYNISPKAVQMFQLLTTNFCHRSRSDAANFNI